MYFLNIPDVEAKSLLIAIIDKKGYDPKDILYGITDPGIYYFDKIEGRFISLSWMENQVKTIKSLFKAE